MTEKQQTSNDYGISQELLVLSELTNYGPVSIPYGNSARYDCILDLDEKLIKIQIKSLNIIDNDTILVPMCNSRLSANGSVRKTYTEEDVDYIAIYFNSWIYLFSPSLARQTLTVRINKPLNINHNQHWIEDFRIDKVLDISLKRWVTLKEETREIKEKHPAPRTRKYKCIDCGIPVWNPNTRCVSCARVLQQSKSAKPTREILKEKIKTTPFTTIGIEYGVTDNAVRKWCKTYNLPYRTCDIKEIIKKGEWDEV